MGSNKRLERVAEECGFNCFILSCPLNREEWRPSRLQLRKHDDRIERRAERQEAEKGKRANPAPVVKWLTDEMGTALRMGRVFHL